MTIEKPSASGDRLSVSRLGMSRSGGFFMRHGNVAHLHRAQLERVDPRELQAAQAHIADARAERVGDRRDAEPLRGRPREHGVLRAGVDDEVLRRRSVDLGADDDLFVFQPEVDGVELVLGAGIHLERHPLAERPQEADFVRATTPPCRCCPCSAAG